MKTSITIEQFTSLPKREIQSLEFDLDQNLNGFDLSELVNLKNLNSAEKGCFCFVSVITSNQFASFPKQHIHSLYFSPNQDLTGFDFSSLPHLTKFCSYREGHFIFHQRITPQQLNALPKANIKLLRFSTNQDLNDFDFSELPQDVIIEQPGLIR